MKLSQCGRLTTRPVTGTWFRAIRPHLLASALVYTHTTTIPGRFNPGTISRPAFPVVYLGEDHMVTLFEVTALLGSPIPGQAVLPKPANPWTIINVSVQLNAVVDLCLPAERRIIQTTVQELTGDWQGYAFEIPRSFQNLPTGLRFPLKSLGQRWPRCRRSKDFSLTPQR